MPLAWRHVLARDKDGPKSGNTDFPLFDLTIIDLLPLRRGGKRDTALDTCLMQTLLRLQRVLMVVGHRVEEGTEGSWVLAKFFFESMVSDSKGADGDGLWHWHIDSSVSICIDKARHAQGHGVLSGATDMVAEDDAGNILLSC